MRDQSEKAVRAFCIVFFASLAFLFLVAPFLLAVLLTLFLKMIPGSAVGFVEDIAALYRAVFHAPAGDLLVVILFVLTFSAAAAYGELKPRDDH